MMPNPKDLEALRAETQQLGSRITRLSIILITTLIIIVLTLTNALNKVDLSDLQRELDTAQTITAMHWRMYYDEAYAKSNQPVTTPTGDKEKENDRLRSLYQRAQEHEKAIKQKHDAAMKESFSITPSVLGSSLTIDLRSWVYSVPFIVLSVFIYILLLRKKQKTVLWIAASQISVDSTHKTVSEFDRLIFSDTPGHETPYTKTPSQLEQAIYLLIVTFLLSLIIVVLTDAEVVLLGLSTLETSQYILMFLVMSFYGISYYSYVENSLDEHVFILTGLSVKPSVQRKALGKLQSQIGRLTLRLRPRVSLTTASLLILSKLFFATAASCERALPGHKLLRENEGASWISTQLPGKSGGLYWDGAVNALGRYSYFLSLLLAVVSLILVLASLSKSRFVRMIRIYSVLFGLSSSVLLFSIIDFAFNMFWFKDEVFILSNLFWLVPSIFLWRMGFRLDNKPRRRGIKPFLIVLVAPLFFSAMVFAIYAASKGFHGVLVYFIGITLLSFSYLAIVRYFVHSRIVRL